jgi:hypothetical protein
MKRYIILLITTDLEYSFIQTPASLHMPLREVLRVRAMAFSNCQRVGL